MTPTLDQFLAAKPAALRTGPIAILLIEDEVETASTLAHAVKAGFRTILALSPEPLALTAPHPAIVNLTFDSRRKRAHVEAVNAVNEAVPPGTWLYYGYNAEYLFFPFSETRQVGEMLAFHAEERRAAMLTYVIDLYAPDLARYPDAVNLDNAMFDRTGYYALGRTDGSGQTLDRQLDFHGGLRWRFEEYLPEDRRRIDRIALFRSRPGLRLLEDHRFDDQEYNTYACRWHNNLTAAIVSFRVAKALRRNPASRDRIDSFMWRNSHPFDWSAQQLMEFGLMEPGQWY